MASFLISDCHLDIPSFIPMPVCTDRLESVTLMRRQVVELKGAEIQMLSFFLAVTMMERIKMRPPVGQSMLNVLEIKAREARLR